MIDYENLVKSNSQFFNAFEAKFSGLLKNGTFVLGDEVKKFEIEFANFCGAMYCVGVGNGLEALAISLKTLPIKKIQVPEVIVPSNTFIASILAILEAGFKPVLVEPDIKTYTIDPNLIEKAITQNTVAILPVHLYGKMCAMDKIYKIAQKYNLFIVEDCAQAHGAALNGKKAGTWGNINGFSCYPTKNLGALGDAGCIVTNNLELSEKAYALRNYGWKVHYNSELLGFNSRLDEFQAAFLRIKLTKLHELTEKKRRLAEIYLNELNDKFIKPVVQEGYYDVYHIFAIRFPERNLLKQYLEENGIRTMIHYPIPPAKQKVLQGRLDSYTFPIAEEIHNTILSLPCSYGTTEEEVMEICKVLNKF